MYHYQEAPIIQVSDENATKKPRVETLAQYEWHGGPRTLGPGRLEALAAWSWEIALTLVPALFIGEFILQCQVFTT
jgi:hypothetical protein